MPTQRPVPPSTEASAPSEAPGQPPAGAAFFGGRLDPPPPPARAVRADGPARVTAATWVAACGAALLLAAAGTFLAVSWGSLGLAARVAVVGAVTGGAIIGGALLRRTLPAVGAVVFHLGALLVPLDALGLALQLDAGRAWAWIGVGATTMLVLPVLAVVGRSGALAAVSVAGVPVLATGLGLDGLGAAPLLTLGAATALLLPLHLATGRGDEGPVAVLGWASPALATVATVLPLLATGAAASSAALLGDLERSGWAAATWSTAAWVTAIAVVVVVVAAVRRRSLVLAELTVLVLVAGVAGIAMPGDAPRLALLLPAPLTFLGIELAATAALRRDQAGGAARLSGRVARAAEVVAAFAIPAALMTAGAPRPGGDAEVAAVAAVAALAWAVAAGRRASEHGTILRAGAAVVLLAAAIGAAAAAGSLAADLPGTVLGAVALSGGGIATLAVRGRGLRAGWAATGTAVVLVGTALVGLLVQAQTWSGYPTPPVWLVAAAGVVGVLVAGGHIRARVGDRGTDAEAAMLLLLPLAALATYVAAQATASLAPGLLEPLVWVVLLLVTAAFADVVPVAGDLMRGLAVLVPVVASFGDPQGAVLSVAPQRLAVPALLVAAIGTAAAAVRRRRPWLLVLAGPTAVRAMYLLLDGAVDGRVAGVLFLAVAGGMAVTALLVPVGRWGAAATGLAAAVPGLYAFADEPLALAWTVVGIGVVLAVAGVALRSPGVAHTGGVLANLGLWQVLDLTGVTAVDVWLAGPALQLWVLGRAARRAGRCSSWVGDVPPLLLVAVPALAERIDGGAGWHAVLVGALAVAGVAGGGLGRLGGPLVVGTVLLAAVILVETFAVVAAVPTWAWLATGGVGLLGTAVLIERTGGAPVASARRLVDVVGERFG